MRMSQNIRILREPEIRRLLDPAACGKAVEDVAAASLALGRTRAEERGEDLKP